jgi:stress response protein YsnF
MTMITVGVFDHERDAKKAHDDLVHAGIADKSIEIYEHESQTPRGDGHGDGLYGWLQSIFGDDGHNYAESHAEAVRRGGHMMTVETDDPSKTTQVGKIMVQDGAVDMDKRAEQWRSEGWTGYREDGEAAPSHEDIGRGRKLHADEKERIPVVEEELEVGKREVRGGHVRVASHVVEHPVEERVTLHEEHAEIERHPVDRPASEEDLRAAHGETIEVTEHAEEPVTAKKARVVEEVEVGKHASEHEEVVRDKVRETRVEVEEDDTRSAEKSRR